MSSPTSSAEAPADLSSTQTGKPAFKEKCGRVHVAVFTNERSTKEGEVFTVYSTNIVRRYKDEKSDKFKDTSYFDEKDLDGVIAAAALAKRFIQENRNKS